jgi:hypothetical protein
MAHLQELVPRRTVARWAETEQLVVFLRHSDVLKGVRDAEGVEPVASYCDHFSQEGITLLYRFLVTIEKNYPSAVRDTLLELGYPGDPVPRLEEEMKRYQPRLEPPTGLLTPLCIISKLCPRFDPKEEQTVGGFAISQRCSITMGALILLQLFAGSPESGKKHLLQLDMTESEKEGLDFVLSSVHRRSCLKDSDAVHLKPFMTEQLTSAWVWFHKQAENNCSLCGLLFQLAKMGVSAEMMDDQKRLEKLEIGALQS